MFNDLDPILHSQLRLSIVSILITVGEANFSFIKDTTKAAAGNKHPQTADGCGNKADPKNPAP